MEFLENPRWIVIRKDMRPDKIYRTIITTNLSKGIVKYLWGNIQSNNFPIVYSTSDRVLLYLFKIRYSNEKQVSHQKLL